MKTTLLRTFAVTVALFVSCAFSARAATPADATVLKVTGNATVTIPGQPARPLSIGMKLPQGSTITTAAGASVLIQPFSGAVTTVNQNTVVSLEQLSTTANADGSVARQTALLKLQSGNVVSMLDPKKKDINDYGVSTPKGVAAARGTQVTTQVDGQNVTVAATADSVTFTQENGTTVEISQGQVIVTVGGVQQAPVPLATLANSTAPGAAEARAAIQTGVAAITAVLQQTSVPGLSTSSAADLASKVVSVAVVADKTQAASITSGVVNAIATSGKSGSDVSDTVATIVAAAAVSAPDQKTAIGTTTVQTLANSAATNAATPANTNNAATATLQALASTLNTVEAKRDLASATAGAAPALTGPINLGVGNTVPGTGDKAIILQGVVDGSGKSATTISTETNNLQVVPPSTTSIQTGIDTGGGNNTPTAAFPAQPVNNNENTSVTN